MLAAIAQLASDLGHEVDPISVLDAVEHTVATSAGVSILVAWRFASEKTNWDAYRLGKNVFWNSKTASTDLAEYVALARKYGPSVMFQRSRHNEGPFTFTEAMRAARPTGNDRWSFDHHARHGRRDGLCCPCGRWVLLFASATVLQLKPETRALLFAAASITTSRLEQIIDHRGLDWREGLCLSPREVTVLQHLSRGNSLAEAAQALAIQRESVKTLLARAQKKLGTRHYAHATAEALRLNLIS